MCFTQQDKCIEYSGPSNAEIGITQGMKQSEFNAQIVLLLSEIKKSLDKCNCSSQSNNIDSEITLSNTTYKEYTKSKCLSEIYNKNFSYSISGIDDKVFSYDARLVNDNLPQGFVLESMRVKVLSGNKLLLNLSGISSGATLKRSELPAKAIFEGRINSNCGNIMLTKELFLSIQDMSIESNFDISDSGSLNTVNTQEEFNQMIYNKLLKIESKI